MTSRDFVFWLQGHIELSSTIGAGVTLSPSHNGQGLSPSQLRQIENHLALVFIHEIDPSNVAASGVSAETAQALHDHGTPQIGGTGVDQNGNPEIYRC